MKDLILRVRLPQRKETEGHVIRNYKLDKNVYNLAKAQTLVNYAIMRNVPVTFMLDAPPPRPFEIRDGKVVEDFTVREFVLDTNALITTSPKCGSGAVSLMLEEPRDDWGED